MKVQYPGVAESLHNDLQMVKPFALKLFNLDSETLDPYIAEVEERVTEETDYRLEVKRPSRWLSKVVILITSIFRIIIPSGRVARSSSWIG